MAMKHAFAVGLALFTVSALGCSSADKVTDTIDCHQVCQRYADCYNSSYDVDGCTSRCESSAADSGANMNELQSCDDCIGDKSCLSATFNCATQCGGIVP
jgi:hypothetical protein